MPDDDDDVATAERAGTRLPNHAPSVAAGRELTASKYVGVIAYQCDLIAARMLLDQSSLHVDHEHSGVVRLHDYRDRLCCRRDTKDTSVQ